MQCEKMLKNQDSLYCGFTAETGFRIRLQVKMQESVRRLSLGPGMKKWTPPFLPSWKVLSIRGNPFQMDFFPESVGSHKVDLI